MIGITLRSDVCWTNRGIVALQSLQGSCLSDIHSRFYQSSKLKKWMCELCTFSQIRSHIYYIYIKWVCHVHIFEFLVLLTLNLLKANNGVSRVYPS